MNRILFPVEKDENQKNAFIYAAKLASFFNAEIVMLSCFTAFSNKENYSEHQQYVRQNIFELNEYIDSLKQYYLQRFSPINDYLAIKIEYRYKEGNLMQHIFAACEKDAFDLVVFTLYNHRAGDERHAKSLLSKFGKKKTNLIVIPEDSYYLHLDNVLFTTDFEHPLSISSITQILNITRFLNTNIHILHNHYLSKDSKEYDVLKSIKKQNNPVHVHHVKSLSEIMFYCHSNEITLMILQKSEETLFENIFKESFTQKIMIQTKIPLLILMNE